MGRAADVEVHGVGRDVVWSVLGRAAGVGATALSAPLLVRVMERDEVGRFYVAATAVGIAGLLALRGLPQEVIRRTGGVARRDVLDRALRLAVPSTALAVVLLAATLAGWFHLGPLLVAGASAWLVAATARTLLSEWLVGAGDVRSATLSSDAISAAMVAVAVAVAWWTRRSLSPSGVVGLHAVAAVAGVALAASMLPRAAGTLHASPAEVTQRLDLDGRVHLGVAVAAAVMLQGPVLLLGLAVGDEAAGLYAPTARMAALLSLPLSAVNVAWAARVAASVSDRAAFAGHLRRSGRLATALALPAGLLVLVAPGSILTTWLGADYADAAKLLRVLAVGHLVNVVVGPAGQGLALGGAVRRLRRATVLGCLVALVGVVVTRDVVGAGVAASAGLVVQNVLCARDLARLAPGAAPWWRSREVDP